MRTLFGSNRGWRTELAMNPEGPICFILLGVATIIGRRLPGALGFCQAFGLSIALGALWVVVFPRYLQDASPSDVGAKSILLLLAGGWIIFADWVVDAMRLICAGKDTSITIPAWVWIIGGLIAASGLLGLVACKKVAFAIPRIPRIALRLCAGIICLAGMLLAVRATIAGLELLRIGTGGQ